MRLSQLIVLGVLLGVGLGWWLRRDAAETTAVSTSATPLTVMATPTAEAATPRASLLASVDAAPDGLLLPVQGVLPSQLRDTFTDARSEGRVHDAIDIMADAGTPVLAVADGTVEKLFDSKRGGLTIYQFEPSGRWCYYYAHLQRYADGLAERQVVRRGEVIGYVGSTGNASADAPHLHFEVHVLGPEKQWWKGESINPYPLLKSAVSMPGDASAARWK
ncbi:M23 family metallopeptidase [uncultured Stenotrophomonas sp.]|uniref:M23 family metallopeptidase n=1 Tax=uncultured Stenotrophomonas sp. TaxID=165438 RepID=UPI0025F72BC5|nr:M23 family metallopeptidase [uncultured Stenotrophomonas sp.]